MADDKIDTLTKDQFFGKIKKVTIPKFKKVILADGEAKITCYRCGSGILEVPVESTDLSANNQEEVAFLRPAKSNYKYESDSDYNEYDLGGYHYKIICRRCAAEMTFNVAQVINRIEQFYGSDTDE